MQLSERIAVTANFYVADSPNFLFLLANDVFNSECCNIVGVVADKGYYVVQHGESVDVVPFEKQSPQERAASAAVRAAASAGIEKGKKVAPPSSAAPVSASSVNQMARG